jgi:hypothetical protein
MLGFSWTKNLVPGGGGAKGGAIIIEGFIDVGLNRDMGGEA